MRTGLPSPEGLELLGIEVRFSVSEHRDPCIEQFGDPRMIAEMKRVFFEQTGNSLGHSYSRLMQGPGGRNDLGDIIGLLREDPASKRAVVTLCGKPNSKVPCINVIQFLVREQKLQTIYFARGQDAYKKFCADGLCLAAMAQKVAAGLEIPAGTVRGFIGSSHVYSEDMPAIERTLERAREYLHTGPNEECKCASC